jgi:hypothetical protein
VWTGLSRTASGSCPMWLSRSSLLFIWIRGIIAQPLFLAAESLAESMQSLCQLSCNMMTVPCYYLSTAMRIMSASLFFFAERLCNLNVTVILG